MNVAFNGKRGMVVVRAEIFGPSGSAHGITKENEIPEVEINRAIARKKAFEQDPTGHTYKEEL